MCVCVCVCVFIYAYMLNISKDTCIICAKPGISNNNNSSYERLRWCCVQLTKRNDHNSKTPQGSTKQYKNAETFACTNVQANVSAFFVLRTYSLDNAIAWTLSLQDGESCFLYQHLNNTYILIRS